MKFSPSSSLANIAGPDLEEVKEVGRSQNQATTNLKLSARKIFYHEVDNPVVKLCH